MEVFAAIGKSTMESTVELREKKGTLWMAEVQDMDSCSREVDLRGKTETSRLLAEVPLKAILEKIQSCHGAIHWNGLYPIARISWMMKREGKGARGHNISWVVYGRRFDLRREVVSIY